MYITYRDNLGLAIVEVNEYGIAIHEGFAYFTDTEGQDFKLQLSQVITITQ